MRSYSRVLRLCLRLATAGIATTSLDASPSRLVNVSSRGTVGQNENSLIVGFVVRGPGARSVLARGVGPTLGQFGVSQPLSAAQLSLFDRTGALAQNAGWFTSPDHVAIEAAGTQVGAFPLRTDVLDAALLKTLGPGAYTAQLTGLSGATGVGLAEIYDLQGAAGSPALINLSARAEVGGGNAVLVTGFVIAGAQPKRLLLRAAGPALAQFGVSNVLLNPHLVLLDAAGTTVSENSGWDRPPNDASSIAAMARSVGAFPFTPGSADAAIIADLPPGLYSVHVRGEGSATGVALAELYDLDPAPDGKVNTAATLYLAALRPDPSSATPASGLLSLQLAPDQRSAILSLTLSNLAGHETSAYVRLGSTYLQRLPMGSFNGFVWPLSDIAGLSVDGLVTALASGQLQLVVSSDRFPAGEIRGTLNRISGTSTFVPPPDPPAIENTFSEADAARLLLQATFGPTDAEIARAQTLGATVWVDDQISRPPTLHLPYVHARGIPDTNQPSQARLEAWWQNSLTAPDQLRQRVAFALSEIFVVSDQADALYAETTGLTNYYDMLLRDSFGNFRQLLEDVTLSPVMGTYLSSLRNRAPTLDGGVRPDENYAREVMQLFSIGLNQLNLDGTVKLDTSGTPIPTYQQATVVGLAHVFTGWSYYTPKPTSDAFDTGTADLLHPMTLFADYHDSGAKRILDGVVLPGGRTGTDDLKSALDAIYNHPNVGPFISLRLIQRLVTSSPSPGYIYRVARVFNDNGRGVRGDLGAVVRAILLDYEARSATATQAPGHGKLREPLLRMASLMRAFAARATNGRYSYWYSLSSIGQAPLSAPSVFNFFDPSYMPPGSLATAGVLAPEFQITTETGVMQMTDEIFNLVFYGVGGADADGLIRLNLEPELLRAADVPALVDHLNALLMAGTMPSAMRTIVINAVTAIPASDRAQRVQSAIYMIAASPDGATQP